MIPWIVMRARNDMPLIAETLAMVELQTHPYKLLVCDNGSTDGTLEVVQQYADHVLHIPEGEYVPGRVLNQALAIADSELVVFLNSDCTPEDEGWLDRLLEGLESEHVAAVFGRQVPRDDCELLYAKDIEDTYGDGRRHQFWRHCFSMASSAIRRSVWERMPFSETLQYSEDIDWTWRARQAGMTIQYQADSVVVHSHNYTWTQFHRRHYGEGCAEARIFDWQPWQRSFLRYSILPYGRQLLQDWRHCVNNRAWIELLKAPVYRLAQLLGRRKGFLTGLERVQNHDVR